MFSPEEIKRSIAQAPAKRDNWAFANDPEWNEWVDHVGDAEVERIVKAGHHVPAVRRLRAALEASQKQLVQRDRPLEMLVASALARVNIVFLGPPGTAKSLLVRTFAQALGVRNTERPIREEGAAVRETLAQAAADHEGNPIPDKSDRRLFEYLLTRYTTPEELFGGANIKLLMEANSHSRRTVGLLPQAEIAFLDEIFKGNSAILNTLLSITNEKIFFNMGQAFKVRLAFVVGASNESPDQQELGALFDRFPIRVSCLPVPDDDIEEVLAKAEVIDAAKLYAGDEKKEEKIPVACLNDIRLLSKVLVNKAFCGTDSDFFKNFCVLFKQLRREYSISDRTPAQLLRVCRALALLETDPDEPLTFQMRHLRAWGYIAPHFQEAEVLQRFVQDHITQKQVEAANLFQ
ncbi:MAG TPA: AAA family ATPase [Chthoniobacteraceae bacterium]|jgi:MoxR-like ATPase|nr:AAA family ATPase [Chthoniobacteraceae bacterium]